MPPTDCSNLCNHTAVNSKIAVHSCGSPGVNRPDGCATKAQNTQVSAHPQRAVYHRSQTVQRVVHSLLLTVLPNYSAVMLLFALKSIKSSTENSLGQRSSGRIGATNGLRHTTEHTIEQMLLEREKNHAIVEQYRRKMNRE